LNRLLIYEPASQRLAAQLEPLRGQVELALIDRDGKISCNGEALDVDTVQPDWGWISPDSFDGAGRSLMVALLKSEKLAWVHSAAAGLDNPIWGQFIAKGAQLTTSHGQAIGIAEYVVGEVIGHFQRLPERRAEQAAHRWKPLPFREIAGSTWLIVGFGAIGQGVAERVRPFGAKVVGVRRTAGEHPLADRMASLDDVRSLLPEADVVVLSTPLNDVTRNLADARFFAAMKPKSVLVNVGRGGLVDEAALLKALDAGVPEFAILDVFHTEPLPQDSPLWDHPKVALTPHASPLGSGLLARNDAVFLNNLHRRLAGEPLLYEADPRDLGK
jgi:phosphoglycerate dehydrogenase-like enzyme